MAPTNTRSFQRCLVVANPTAGTITEDVVAEVARYGERHTDVSVVWTTKPGDATAAVAGRTVGGGRELVIAVGGDGTVLEVVRGLVGRPPDDYALFVVPAGTGNSNYRAFWGERPWQEALETTFADGVDLVRRIDLAKVAELDELVVLGAGTGLTAEVLLGVTEIPTRGRGRLSAGLERAAAVHVPYPGQVTVDGVVVHKGATVSVSVGGGRHRAWQYLVLPCSELDDGLLDVCVVGAEVPPDRLPALFRTGAHIAQPGVVYAQGRRVVIERTDDQPLCFEHDGELATEPATCRTIDVLPKALSVVCAEIGE